MVSIFDHRINMGQLMDTKTQPAAIAAAKEALEASNKLIDALLKTGVPPSCSEELKVAYASVQIALPLLGED